MISDKTWTALQKPDQWVFDGFSEDEKSGHLNIMWCKSNLPVDHYTYKCTENGAVAAGQVLKEVTGKHLRIAMSLEDWNGTYTAFHMHSPW